MEKTFNNKYKVIDIIGKPSFGIIYKVLEIGTENLYALKLTFASHNVKKISEEHFEKKIQILKNIKNKYIIELKDYFFDQKQEGYCIVMELCDCSLRDILNKYKPNGLPINIIKKIFIQLNEALKIMIEKKYIHRDLKPENILIKYSDKNKTDFDIKLTGFGLSLYEYCYFFGIYTDIGQYSDIYIAPEVDNIIYNNKSDLWSLGIILYELYTNKRVKGWIVEETDNEMINKLISKLIQVDIEKRIGWEEYFNDDFFKIKEEKEKNKKTESELNSNLLVK